MHRNKVRIHTEKMHYFHVLRLSLYTQKQEQNEEKEIDIKANANDTWRCHSLFYKTHKANCAARDVCTHLTSSITFGSSCVWRRSLRNTNGSLSRTTPNSNSRRSYSTYIVHYIQSAWLKHALLKSRAPHETLTLAHAANDYIQRAAMKIHLESVQRARAEFIDFRVHMRRATQLKCVVHWFSECPQSTKVHLSSIVRVLMWQVSDIHIYCVLEEEHWPKSELWEHT